MNKNTLLKYLIPVVAIAVILESVVIVSGLVKKNANQQKPAGVSVIEEGTSGVVSTKNNVNPKDAMADMVFGVDNKSMKVGKTYMVTLSVYPKKDFTIDATDLYVKYDQNAFDVGKLTFSNTMGKPTANKVSKEKGLVVVNYWISDPKGYGFSNGKLDNILSFEVTPKKAGNFDFQIATGDASGNSATMLVEKSTAKVLPFASDKLTVSVSK